MIKRLVKVLFFIPVLFFDCGFIIFQIFNWLFTGEGFSNSFFIDSLLDW
jgi:hypothetical protein